MPPSRKRNKGKDRKAKQLAKKEENDKSNAHRFWRSFCSSYMCCNHGHPLVPDNHPVSSFIDQFCLNFGLKEMTAVQNVRDMFITHAHIWTDEHHRKLAIGVLTHIGTNMLVTVTEESYNTWLICLAQSILVLEHFNGTDVDLTLNKQVVVSKGRDLATTNIIKRDLLKFFRKRTSCKCLKKMHLEARKSTPKMGICRNCDKVMERVSLSVCSRCIIDQYCSKQYFPIIRSVVISMSRLQHSKE